MQVLPRFRGTFVIGGAELSDRHLLPLAGFLKQNPHIDYNATTHNTILIYGDNPKQDAFVSSHLNAAGVPFQLNSARITLKKGFGLAETLKNATRKLLQNIQASHPATNLNMTEKLTMAATAVSAPSLDLPLDQLYGLRLKELAEDAYAAQDYPQALELFHCAEKLLPSTPVDIYNGTPKHLDVNNRPIGEVKAYLGFLYRTHAREVANADKLAVRYLHEANFILNKTLPYLILNEKDRIEDNEGRPRVEQNLYYDELTEEEQEAFRVHADTKQMIGRMYHQQNEPRYALEYYQDAFYLYRGLHGDDSPYIQHHYPQLLAYIKKFKPSDD